ncbi:30S ribosomal protein S20 [Rickettsiales endosymbiont of Peranema trichophorum]|uniref:30S ribosomal protein S20 n=1 Tax=Rickettsiales endosymbiont of Peranema trichophorum TaxID=2486577 RepID=UPI0010233407|nr:30S ribosomal protein S20 [Rickettsiales endosymbiont of Peranema trichophorum]RZI47583.1 30S ribosomal protein S20 [Rickettsiales endosymbiont of Peranema trichophorum]
MANHKSAAKAFSRSTKLNAINRSRISRIKTFLGKVEAFIRNRDFSQAKSALVVAESEMMKGVSKGVLKLNTASRRISKLCMKVKALDQHKA